MPQNLTKRQEQVLKFIRDHISRKGYPPSFREIGKHHAITSTNGVNCILLALQKKGFIKRSTKISRGIELIGPVAAISPPAADAVPEIPILGHIAAGKPIWAEENFSGSVKIDPSFIRRRKNVFALKVRGDSMIEAGILPNDLLLAEQQSTAENGDIVVALIGDEATVKKFYPGKDQIRLVSANPRYSPILLTKNSGEFRIAGKVIGIIRKYC
jgi:repressor LexA